MPKMNMGYSGRAKYVSRFIVEERRRKGILSKVHDWDHIENVARYGGRIAKGLARRRGLNAERAREIAECAGYFHDIVREPTEVRPHAIEGAKWILFANRLRSAFNDGWGVIYRGLDWDPAFVKDVAYAIAYHEWSIADAVRRTRFEVRPTERACATVGMKIADALIEASGYRVLERIARFTGYERIRFGDLVGFGERIGYEKPHLWAVLAEFMVRLYKRNPVKGYPPWIRDLAEELHSVWYEFYSSLFKILSKEAGAKEEGKLAEMFYNLSFPKFDEALVLQIYEEAHLTKGVDGFERINEAIGRGFEDPEVVEFLDAFYQEGDTAKVVQRLRSNRYVQGVDDYINERSKSIDEWLDEV